MSVSPSFQCVGKEHTRKTPNAIELRAPCDSSGHVVAETLLRALDRANDFIYLCINEVGT